MSNDTAMSTTAVGREQTLSRRYLLMQLSDIDREMHDLAALEDQALQRSKKTYVTMKFFILLGAFLDDEAVREYIESIGDAWWEAETGVKLSPATAEQTGQESEAKP